MAHGQGDPLPSFMAVEGEWIIEDVALLYHSGHLSKASFTLAQERQDGSYAIGFDSAQLAASFGIEIDALVQANRNQTLVFVGTSDVAPIHGGASAVEYLFRIGETTAILTIESDQQEGTA
jgi:hypothetical protein